MLKAVALALLAGAQGQDPLSPELDATANGLNVRLPRNTDMYVERTQRTGVQDLQTRVEEMASQTALDLAATQVQAENAAYNATLAATSHLYGEIQQVGNNVATQMAAMNAQMNTMQATMTAEMSSAMSTAAVNMAAQASTQAAQLSTTTASLNAGINAAISAQASSATAFQNSVNAALVAGTACNGMGKFLNTTTGQCVAFSTMVLGRSAGTSCSTTGAIRINSAINRVEVCASNKWWAPMPVVSNFLTHGGEGCENCWINRQLTFTKRLADTYVRILWTDVGRSHGWGSEWNRYHLRICDSNGGNCGDCQDPGHMRTTRHMNQWHGWWSDHYMPMATSALCRRRNGVNMGAGTYRLRIWCDGGDSYLGWSGSQANIQIDEVYKA